MASRDGRRQQQGELAAYSSRPPAESCDPAARVVVVGARACGKTSLLHRFTHGTFSDTHEATVAMDCSSSRLLQVDDTCVRLDMCDTSGQQAFLPTATTLLGHCDGVIFVYDVTDEQGFAELTTWLQLVNRFARAKDLPKVLVGTKLDLKFKQVVSASRAKEFGIPEGMEHVETSAKAGKNINVPFYMLAKQILRWRRLGSAVKIGVPSMSALSEPSVVEKIEEVQDEREYTHLFKILLVGAARVGKTAARYRFCRDYYTSHYHATSGLEYSTRTLRIDGDNVKLQVWDVGGDPAYDATRKNYYRGANGFIIMFDVSAPATLSRAEMLVKELAMYEQWDSPKVVVANKQDLHADAAAGSVDMDAAREWAHGWRLPLLEASARTPPHNIDQAFLTLLTALKRQMAPWKRLYNFDN